MVFFSSCIAQEESNTNLKIFYLAQTRGSFLNITFNENTISYKSNDKTVSLDLSETQIENITLEVSKINLKEIYKLTSPSNKRFTDGALSASFKIVKDNNEYVSSDFDHELPPKELVPLYNLLIGIIKKG